MFPSLLPQIWKCICSKEGGANTFVYIVYVQVIGVWWWVFGPVQTVAIILEAHNFLEYHYML